MWHFSPFSSSFALCFLFFLLATPTRNAISVDIISETCQKCADGSAIFDYDFCLTSLQAVPASRVTNLQGLAIIGMELALENATDTISTIKNLLTDGTFDPFALACLEDCLQLYSGAVVMLVDGVAAFLTGHYDIASVQVSAALEASETCEGGFLEKKGEVSPLTKENYNLFELCDIALCTIHSLSVAPPPDIA